MSTSPLSASPQQSQSFFASLRMQMDVIGALLMRELHTRYGRDNVGYLWMVLEPMMLATAVGGLHAGAAATHYGTDIRPIPFALLGYCTFIVFRGIFSRSEGMISSNQPLLYHRSVTLLDMSIARALLDGIGVSMTLAILLTLAVAFDIAAPPARPLWLILAEIYMILWSWAAGMICCAGTYENHTAARLVHPATYILMPLCGGFYMLDWIPKPYQDWLWYFPMVHIFEMARYGLFEGAPYRFVNLDYVTGGILALTIMGLLSLRIVRRHIHLT
jgi:capsular polysaccharide transport system permease protein